MPLDLDKVPRSGTAGEATTLGSSYRVLVDRAGSRSQQLLNLKIYNAKLSEERNTNRPAFLPGLSVVSFHADMQHPWVLAPLVSDFGAWKIRAALLVDPQHWKSRGTPELRARPQDSRGIRDASLRVEMILKRSCRCQNQ